MPYFLIIYYTLLYILEIHTNVQIETGVVGFLESITADVGKTKLVGKVGIEQLVFNATTKAKTSVKTLEEVARECRLDGAVGVTLDLSSHSISEITADEGLEGELAIKVNTILHKDGQFEIVEIEVDILLLIVASALLCIEQSRLKIYGSRWRELETGNGTNV